MNTSLTASENFISRIVRLCLTIRFGSFYLFDPPQIKDQGEWSFPQSGGTQRLVERFNNLAQSLFEVKLVDWRPNGGSVAEDAVMMGVCKSVGDALIHFSHSQGGHFAIEPLAARMGIKCFHLPVDNHTLHIDVERLGQLLKEHPEIKLVMLDQSFKLRMQPLERIKKCLPKGVVLAYDCSHDGGLIAGGVLQQPIASGVDILFGNTHKTIPGPQKAFVGWADPTHWSVEYISEAIVPTLQSNCHAECLLSMVVSFKELEVFGKAYAKQVVNNAKAFANALNYEGFHVNGESFGFTETQQVHVVIGSPLEALEAWQTLEKVGIRVNNIEIPGQRGNHGLRLGTQAMTRCGMKESDFEELARLMARVLLHGESVSEIRALVEDFDSQFSRDELAFSFDPYMDEEWMKNFINELLK